MAWRTVSTVVIVVAVLALAQMFLISPLIEVTSSLNDAGDWSNEYYDGNELIAELPTTWLDMGLIAIFGVMTWGIYRIVRREITQGRGGI